VRPPPFSRRGRRRLRESRPRRVQIITALLLVLGFAASGTAGAAAYFLPVLSATLQLTGRTADLPSASPTAAPAPGSPFTVLLLGSDDDAKFDPKQVLTQSMILVRVNPQTQQVTMLSIPRDLWVPLSVGGSDRIDVAYAYGGPSAAIATVERDFHVHVDDYVWIGLKGLIKVINIVGGVDVLTSNPVLDDYYPSDIDVQNPYGYYRVAVLPGAQHLDGAHALEYVRSRHSDLRGDFGRSQRQQQVLLALRARAKTLKPTDLPDVASAFAGELTTSMSLTRIRDLFPLASRLQPDSVHQVVLFGDYTIPTVISAQDVLLPNWDKILPVVSQYFP
jgi:LCP family protein required for cell wall assembly